MMKKCWRKVYILVTIITVALMLPGCTSDKEKMTANQIHGKSDLEFVQSKGTLVVGVTDFAPMDYHDKEGWSGFDADLAVAFADSIGVTAKLVEIDWTKKRNFLKMDALIVSGTE